ncbi:hypothetical protein HGO21_24940 [Acinetobacter sp. CUI P1]|nr:hypothetical protein [Acinetobacter sp. CUI P1]
MNNNMNNQLSYNAYPYLGPSVTLAYRSALESVYSFPVNQQRCINR